jgi:hypothetical protein
MSNSKLVISNQKIKLIESRNKLQIKKGQLILNEDVTSVSSEQAIGMISDTFKSTVNIGKGLIKFYVAQIRLAISVILLPLTRDLESMTKNYSDDLENINTLFKESIPQNVENTANLIKIANNPNFFIVSKVIENFKNVPGIEDISKIKDITQTVFPKHVKNILNHNYDIGKNAASTFVDIFTKKLPEFARVDHSYYEDIKNHKLEEILKKLRGREIDDDQNPISGKPIKLNNSILKTFLDEIVNEMKNSNFSTARVNAFIDKNQDAFDCIYYILTLEADKKFTWDIKNAIPPLNTLTIARFELDDSVLGNDIHITISKIQKVVNNNDLKNCYIAIDDGTNQLTENLNFYTLFI